MDKFMDKSNYFTTGEFAKICGVNKQTLFYYDSIGILQPAIVDESNEYRYYSYIQIEIFSVISMLRELGMPLKDIKEYVDHRTPEALIRLFEAEAAEVDRRMDRLKKLRRYIDSRLALTREGINAESERVFWEDCKQEYVFATKYEGSVADRDIASATKEHFLYCTERNLQASSTIGGLIYFENMPKERLYKYDMLYTRLFPPVPKALVNQSVDITLGGAALQDYSRLTIKKAAGKYACIYHRHGFDEAAKSYSKLLSAVKSAGLKAVGPFYEDSILDELTMHGYENYVIKISIAVTE